MKKSAVFICAITFLAMLCATSAKPVLEPENSWSTKSPMPTARSSFGVAVVDKKIYAIGGSLLSVNEEYDPATDSWTTKKSMPTARMSFAITVCENKIYVIGGYYNWSSSKGAYLETGINEVYDPATDSWETKAPMPTPRGQMTASTVNGKIYVIGGIVDPLNGRISNLNEVYDPATDTWITKAQIPKEVYSPGAAVVDDKIYVIETQFDAGLQIYDPKTNIWSKGAPPINETHSSGVGATTGLKAPKRIYVFGGSAGFMEATNTNQIYDPQTDSWSIGAPMPTRRAGLAVAVVDDLLYALGGYFPEWYSTESTSCELNGKFTLLSNHNVDTANFVPQKNCAANEQYTPIEYGTIKPVISVVSPKNKTYNQTSVSLTFTVDKPVSWIGYSLDGRENMTVTGNTTLTDLPNGPHNLTAYAKYTEGSIGASENVTFTIIKPEPEPFSTTLIVTASGTAVAVIGIAMLVYFKKRNTIQKT